MFLLLLHACKPYEGINLYGNVFVMMMPYDSLFSYCHPSGNCIKMGSFCSYWSWTVPALWFYVLLWYVKPFMRQSWVCPVPLKRISLFILSRSLHAGPLTSKGSSWPGSLLLPPLRLESSVLQALTKTQPPSPPTTQDFPSRGFPSAWSTELNCFLSERERVSLSKW